MRPTFASEFTESLGFSRVLEHEIGHAIGLGHTDDDFSVVNPEANIMNSACCYPETPAPPAIGPDDLAGLNFIYPSNLTGPQMTLDRTSLRFGALTNGATLLTKTSEQIVRLTQMAAGTVTWTASSNQPWLQVSPASGSGSANLSIASCLPPADCRWRASVDGSDQLHVDGASNTPGPIAVNADVLRQRHFGESIVNRRYADRQPDGRDGTRAVHGLGARRHRGGAGDGVPGGVRRGEWRRWIPTAAARRRFSSASRCSSRARGRMLRQRIRPIR